MIRHDPRIAFWLCFAVAAVDGFDTLVVSFIAPAFAAEWSLDAAKVGQVFGIGLLGAAIGGVLAGRMADKFGRKRVLLGCVALFATLTLGCAFAPDANTLMALRFVAGLGLGGSIPTITALVAETMPAEKRVASVTRMFLGFPLGAVIGGALSAVMVEEFGWHSTFILGGVLGLVLFPLLMRGIWEPEVEESSARAVSVAAISQPPRVLGGGSTVPAIALWTAAFLILLVSYFLINWTPSILVASGMPQQQAILGGVVLNLGGVVGAGILTMIVGRYAPFLLAGLLLVAGSILISVMGQQLHSVVLASVLVFTVGMTVIGGQLALPALASSLFDKSVRATGVGLTMGIGRIGSIIGPSIGGVLVGADLGWPVLFAIVAAPAMGAGLALLLIQFLAARAR